MSEDKPVDVKQWVYESLMALSDDEFFRIFTREVSVADAIIQGSKKNESGTNL